MALFLGRREAVVVLVAVPATLALTLFSSYLFGYTLNRVTLFALIFAIGILVDDAIVVVENIHRHYELGWGEPRLATVYAVDEVGNPTILATFAVVGRAPPARVRLRPDGAVHAADPGQRLGGHDLLAPRRLRRLAVAHVPALPEVRRGAPEGTAALRAARRDGRRGPARPLLPAPLHARSSRRPRAGWALIGAVVVLLLLSLRLFVVRGVKVKMLPYDNKSEIQVVVDMPEGTTLEATAAAARDLARDRPRSSRRSTDIEVYAGTSAPFNFNGLVRHYFLRSGPLVADLQVNLRPKDERTRDSHTIAKDVRTLLQPTRRSASART